MLLCCYIHHSVHRCPDCRLVWVHTCISHEVCASPNAGIEASPCRHAWGMCSISCNRAWGMCSTAQFCVRSHAAASAALCIVLIGNARPFMALCKLNSIQKGHHAVSELGWAQCLLHVVGWDGMHEHELPLGWLWALFFYWPARLGVCGRQSHVVS